MPQQKRVDTGTFRNEFGRIRESSRVFIQQPDGSLLPTADYRIESPKVGNPGERICVMVPEYPVAKTYVWPDERHKIHGIAPGISGSGAVPEPPVDIVVEPKVAHKTKGK